MDLVDPIFFSPLDIWLSMVHASHPIQGVDHLGTFSGEGRILRPRPSCRWLQLWLRDIPPKVLLIKTQTLQNTLDFLELFLSLQLTGFGDAVMVGICA